uniref:Neur_chan_LBD domain-containing protein n=1 Tax=Macrostomum lignano TaxID=282301 RepID=A0A1I8GWB3_9PLAT
TPSHFSSPSFGVPGARAGRNEKRLLQHLLENKSNLHNPMERPVENDTEILYVWFKVSLQQIIDVSWTDYHFKWDPADFGNITKINIDPKRVWRPDVLLYNSRKISMKPPYLLTIFFNSADEKFDATYPTNVVIDNTGFMTYIPPGMFKSTCKIDITWFPFDMQECLMKFGSWTYDGGTVDLRFKCANESLKSVQDRLNDPRRCTERGSGDTSNYVKSGEWNLEGLLGVRTGKLYDCCPHPFVDLKFYMRIRRRQLYFLFNMLGPVAFLSTLAILCFLIPPDDGEKVCFGMPGQRTALLYDCCPFPFIDLKYRIKIRRRTLYYGFNLIIPCVLISTMTLLTFLLPPDAGEKISLGVTILLSLIMFLLLVADAMPQTSESLPLIGVTILLSLTVFLMTVGEAMPATSDSVPVIGMYFACTMIMCSLSVVFTVIVLNYHHRNAESHPIPNWVRKFICVYLASILCMRHHGRTEHSEPIRVRRRLSDWQRRASQLQRRSGGLELRERCSKSLLANVLDIEDNFRTSVHRQQRPSIRSYPTGLTASFDETHGWGQERPLPHQQLPTDSPTSYSACQPGRRARDASTDWGSQLDQPDPKQPDDCNSQAELEAIIQELRFVTRKIANDVADGEVSSEWKFAARVIDRLCLILFSGFTLIATCAILFSAPDVFKG